MSYSIHHIAASPSLDVADRLRASRASLQRAVHELPAAAWTARRGGARWTACEILEHLALTEWSVVEFVRGALLALPPLTEPTALPDDAAVLRAACDRARPLDAPERLLPLGRWGRAGMFCASIDAARSLGLTLAERDLPALRARALPHPQLGLLDGAQWLLFLAGHTERHAAQLGELAGRWIGAPAAA